MGALRFQLKRILPTLASIGYDSRIVEHKAANEEPFHVRIDRKTQCQFNKGCVELLEIDSTSVTDNQEAVMLVWTDSGHSQQKECSRIAEALTQANIPARCLKYQNINVVAFDAGNWMDEAV